MCSSTNFLGEKGKTYYKYHHIMYFKCCVGRAGISRNLWVVPRVAVLPTVPEGFSSRLKPLALEAGQPCHSIVSRGSPCLLWNTIAVPCITRALSACGPQKGN